MFLQMSNPAGYASGYESAARRQLNERLSEEDFSARSLPQVARNSRYEPHKGLQNAAKTNPRILTN